MSYGYNISSNGKTKLYSFLSGCLAVTLIFGAATLGTLQKQKAKILSLQEQLKNAQLERDQALQELTRTRQQMGKTEQDLLQANQERETLSTDLEEYKRQEEWEQSEAGLDARERRIKTDDPEALWDQYVHIAILRHLSRQKLREGSRQEYLDLEEELTKCKREINRLKYKFGYKDDETAKRAIARVFLPHEDIIKQELGLLCAKLNSENLSEEERAKLTLEIAEQRGLINRMEQIKVAQTVSSSDQPRNLVGKQEQE